MSVKYLKYSALCTLFLGTLQGAGQTRTRRWDRWRARGQLGANLTFNEEQALSRPRGDVLLHARRSTTLHALGWTFGAGFKVADPSRSR